MSLYQKAESLGRISLIETTSGVYVGSLTVSVGVLEHTVTRWGKTESDVLTQLIERGTEIVEERDGLRA